MSESSAKRGRSSRSVFLVIGLLWIVLAIIILTGALFTQPVIEINWSTESEIDTAGFNIYRSLQTDQGFRQLNDTLIGSSSDAVSGAEYSYMDENVIKGKTYYYQLEDVEFDGSTSRHPLISGRAEIIAWQLALIVAACLLLGVFFLYRSFRSEGN